MHTLTFKKPGSGEQRKLFRVPTGTAISLVANGIARFADRRTQKEVRHLIETISGRKSKR
jgi:hypothetical protein